MKFYDYFYWLAGYVRDKETKSDLVFNPEFFIDGIRQMVLDDYRATNRTMFSQINTNTNLVFLGTRPGMFRNKQIIRNSSTKLSISNIKPISGIKALLWRVWHSITSDNTIIPHGWNVVEASDWSNFSHDSDTLPYSLPNSFSTTTIELFKLHGILNAGFSSMYSNEYHLTLGYDVSSDTAFLKPMTIDVDTYMYSAVLRTANPGDRALPCYIDNTPNDFTANDYLTNNPDYMK